MERPSQTIPRVSVVIANYNGARYLDAAIRSALQQTVASIEVIVVDDQSQDDSVAVARAIAACDPRVVVEQLAHNGGPSAARNRALALARGEWLAILDSDDLMHPDRIDRLIAIAERDGADIVADDLLIFADDDSVPPRRFFEPAASEPAWIELSAYLGSGRMFAKEPSLGFLKPVIRRAALERHGIRYDEGLRIGEDDVLIVQMLTAGLRYRLVPTLGYFYRKHGSSISHRITARDLEAIAVANARARRSLPPGDTAAVRAMDRRDASIDRALAFTAAVTALKARRPVAAARALARRPGAIPLLRMLVEGAIAKRRTRKARPSSTILPVRRGTIVSRASLQSDRAAWSRLIDTARHLRAHGIEPHLLHFGDAGTPPPGVAAFATRTMRTTATADWTDQDRLAVAGIARPHGDVILADGPAAAEALIYALRPDAAIAILTGGPAADMPSAGPVRLPVPIASDGTAAPLDARAAPPHFFVEDSNEGTAVVGVRWLLDQVWPIVVRQRPDARLTIVGGVGLSLDALPRGVAASHRQDDATVMVVARSIDPVAAAPVLAALRRDVAVIGMRGGLADLAVPAGAKVKYCDDAESLAVAMLATAIVPMPEGGFDRWLTAALNQG